MNEHIKRYMDEMRRLIDAIPAQSVDELVEILSMAGQEKRKIFVAGNGGSAATANHFVCDFGKNARTPDSQRFKIISLCDNMSYVTAYGNDMGYNTVFTEQLSNLMEPQDILLAISVSGNSPNIIHAVEYARNNGSKVISLCGFSGGKLRDLSHHSIIIQSDSYEKVEDAHSIILHSIICSTKERSVKRIAEAA